MERDEDTSRSRQARRRGRYARDALLRQRSWALLAGAVLLAALLALALVTGEPAITFAALALAVFAGAGFLVQWVLRRLP